MDKNVISKEIRKVLLENLKEALNDFDEYIYQEKYKETALKLDIEVKNKHELDAYLCYLTAKMFLEGKTIEVGNNPGIITVPIEP